MASVVDGVVLDPFATETALNLGSLDSLGLVKASLGLFLLKMSLFSIV